MGYNLGRYQEKTFVYLLDGTKIKDMHKDARAFMRAIYGELDDEEIVRSEIINDFRKPDFYVIYKGEKKFISMKTGDSHTLHEENLESFIAFLSSLGVDNEALNLMRYLFWGDNTLDGSGERVFRQSTAVEYCPEIVKKFNEKMNADKTIIQKVIEKVTFDGKATDGIVADYIFHYEPNKVATVVSREQVLRYIQTKEWDFLDNPHIGPLQFAPKTVRKESKNYEFNRKRISIWWSRLFSDLTYIEQHYVVFKKGKAK